MHFHGTLSRNRLAGYSHEHLHTVGYRSYDRVWPTEYWQWSLGVIGVLAAAIRGRFALGRYRYLLIFGCRGSGGWRQIY
jgi:hypothetical protein